MIYFVNIEGNELYRKKIYNKLFSLDYLYTLYRYTNYSETTDFPLLSKFSLIFNSVKCKRVFFMRKFHIKNILDIPFSFVGHEFKIVTFKEFLELDLLNRE